MLITIPPDKIIKQTGLAEIICECGEVVNLAHGDTTCVYCARIYTLEIKITNLAPDPPWIADHAGLAALGLQGARPMCYGNHIGYLQVRAYPAGYYEYQYVTSDGLVLSDGFCVDYYQLVSTVR